VKEVREVLLQGGFLLGRGSNSFFGGKEGMKKKIPQAN
jgi:hypothetical protein